MCLVANSHAPHRNLVNANHVFFVSPLHTYQKAKYDAIMRQSAGRALRLMQTRKVHIYMCAVINTVDVDILEMRTASRLLKRYGPKKSQTASGHADADVDSDSDNDATPRPYSTDESSGEEMPDAPDDPLMPQGTKRKRNMAEIDDTDNASAKRTKNARLRDRPTEQTDIEMDDDDAALARQLQGSFDRQATDAAIAQQMQTEEYQSSADEHSEDGDEEGIRVEHLGQGSIRWVLKNVALLNEDEQKQRWGTGFEKAPDDHDFE